jgi:hypothetical protein
MPPEDSKRSLHRVLVERILNGPGHASARQRADAFHQTERTGAAGTLLAKVAARSAQITDADFTAVAQAGWTDDQVFELVICAAVGEATRQYEAGLAALAEAVGAGEPTPGAGPTSGPEAD